MRKLMLAAILSCLLALPLVACNTPGASTVTSAIGTIAAAQPDITNNLSLACQSADGLLGLAASKGSGTFSAAAGKLDGYVAKYCGEAIAAGPVLANALNLINTAAAVLLGLGVAL